MKYNPDIHHRRSIRLKGYDYSQAGLYFITICTKNRLCLFGKIKNGKMILNDSGQSAEHCWMAIPHHYPKTQLHEYVVMPNHVHGIVGVQNLEPLSRHIDKRVQNLEPMSHNIDNRVQNFEPLHPLQPPQKNQYQKTIPRSIGAIVRGFKIGVTKWFRKNTDIHTVWQRNFYEHIIHDEKSCYQILQYIKTNPLKWQDDQYYA
ncbi:MAG: hypothetical protein JJV92_10245 [Desulfosarcina sp.]|nr:hypothetical protein [Desulfobacterales bacterium]